MMVLTEKQQEAILDLPIICIPTSNPLNKEQVVWEGISGKQYSPRTIRAIVRKGFAQYLPSGLNNDKYPAVDDIHLYDHPTYKAYNERFSND